MTKQINTNIPKLLTGLAVGATLAAGRTLSTTKVESSDSFALPSNQGRALQQTTFTPAVASPPPPVVPSPPPPASPGYTDILAGNTVCGAVVPDWNHYGACSEGVTNTVNRVSALAAQGCHAFNLDLFESNLAHTATFNATTLGFIQQVATEASNLGMVMLVGPSKDDVTMNNRVPTTNTQDLLVTLANQFKSNPYVGLNAGGMPHNEDGSQTPAIAATYGQISAAVRATGYKGLLTFTAPERDGRTGLSYFVPTANRIQDPNMRFVVYPYSDGNTTETTGWMAPCVGTLPCAVVTGVQVNSTLGLNNTLAAVTSEVNFANANGIPSLLTPWDNAAVLSSQGEQVMLGGNACASPNATVTVTSTGQALLNLQKGIAG